VITREKVSTGERCPKASPTRTRISTPPLVNIGSVAAG
jgi:hypothetical protein